MGKPPPKDRQLRDDPAVTPDPRDRRRSSPRAAAPPQVRTSPSSDDVHEVVYFRRHSDDDAQQTSPGRAFLRDVCPVKVRATMRSVLAAVAAAPPKRFAGGGYWEAMKGDMTGWYEVRVDGPGRHHYRLSCLLDYQAEGVEKPLLVVVTGLDKPFRTVLSDRDYQTVRDLGEEYRKRNPRSTQ
jgi:hypothetical protein